MTDPLEREIQGVWQAATVRCVADEHVIDEPPCYECLLEEIKVFALRQRQAVAREAIAIVQKHIVGDKDPESLNGYADGVCRGIATALREGLGVKE